MSRLPLTFACGSLQLAGTLDTAPGTTGLLIVNGGNEIKSGAFAGQAGLAATIARAGFPVFRFDRRGIGDSEGENRGFRKSMKDLSAALEAFRAISPQMTHVVAFGNCDAASALMLAGGAGCDGLVLSNPWTIDEDAATDETPPPSAIRSRYAEKLKNPREVLRLLTGGVNLRKLVAGLRKASSAPGEGSRLARDMLEGIKDYQGRVRFLVAENDRTAQVFLQNWPAADERIVRCANAGHSYVEPHAREWLRDQLLDALRSQRAK